jgi:hypothetical protein
MHLGFKGFAFTGTCESFIVYAFSILGMVGKDVTTPTPSSMRSEELPQ